ncbi:MAG: SGNH/GDSL hydrolase family protein [Betaproteobacteria bacterium]
MKPIVVALPLVALLLALHGNAIAKTKAPTFDPPKRYYLALGDSVTYGYQASAFNLPPSAVSTGYVDDFGATLRQLRPRISTVNFGCPGETMASFVTGTCPWTANGHQLHDNFVGSQLEAALIFLRTHHGKVSPITLTLWGNDVAAFVNSCSGDPTCIQNGAPAFVEQFSMNLSAILQSLRVVAPRAEIIVTGGWDSFIGSFNLGDPLFEALNESMEIVAAEHRVRFADPFPVFNPQGDVNAETQAMCLLTLLCTTGDSHPSDTGYKALADIVFEASDYADLLEDSDDGD